MVRHISAASIALGSVLLASAPALAAPPAAYFMVQGRQILLLEALPGQNLSDRANEIRRRLEAAVSKDGTVQPHGAIKLTDVGGTPVVSVGNQPIASITPQDAARAGQSAWPLAGRWAATLGTALETLRIGGPLPSQFVVLKGTDGIQMAFMPPPATIAPGSTEVSLAGGRVTASVSGGIVTLTGKAATLAEKLDISRSIANVPGVVDIVDKVVVEAPQMLSDSDLAMALTTVIQ